ncbi:MAG TPA: hypothetical protein VNP37_10050 [Actinomycetospora sp.]|nr:hypothetical protein [Actinomycetospora sp.]
MRKSLSQTSVATASAVLLSSVLLVAAVVDQIALRSLGDHAVALYAPHGVPVAPGVLYALVDAVAVVGVVLWLLVLRAVLSGRRSAPVLAVVAVAITVTLAAVLLGATEYGAPIFPPVWGVLALLPPVAGSVAVVRLVRRRSARVG